MLTMKKILPFDTETSGFSDNAAVLTMSGFVIVEGIVKEGFDFRMRPHKDAEMSDEAFETTGIDPVECLSWQDPAECINKYITPMFDRYVSKYDKFDKLTPLGQNVKFDIEKVNELYGHNLTGNAKKYRCGSYLTWAGLDTLELANWWIQAGMLNLPDRKLSTLCEAFGIDIGNAHTSLDDIKATIKVAERLWNHLKITGIDSVPIIRNY